MTHTVNKSRPPIHPDGADRRLLRICHIFSSTISDTLEARILRQVSPLNLSPPQLLLLRLMSLNGEHQAGEVADILGVTRPAATKNIDKLVRNGLIVRRRSQGDRRATLLTISPKGRRLVQRHEAMKRNRIRPLLDQYTPSELDQLTSLLEQFSVALLRRAPRMDGPCLRCGTYLDSDCPIGSIQGGCPYGDLRDRLSGGSRTGGMA